MIHAHGRDVFVSCGHCPDCRNRKMFHYTRLCDIEAQSHKYTYFFTLTYDDVYIPKAYAAYIPEIQQVKYYDCTKRPLKTKKNGITRYKYFNCFHNCIATITGVTDLDNYILWLSKATRSFKYGSDNDFAKGHIIRYCRKQDIQCFFKRFRYYLGKICDSSVSFYCVAEYGPRSFRPHYHVILYFDDPLLVENLEGLLNKSWQFGDVRRIEAAKSANACGQYVAGYCNSFTTLPRYLDADGIRPFSLHSQHFGAKLNTYLRDTMYKDPQRATGETNLPSPFGKYTYFPNVYHQSRLFPRCYRYEQQNIAGKYQLYTCYRFYSKLYRTTNCAEIVRRLVSDRYRHINFLKTLDIYVISDLPKRLDGFTPLYLRDISDLTYNSMDKYDQMVYNRLYSAFNLSRHFRKFCCVNDVKRYCEHRWHHFTRLRDPESVINIIDEYYKYLPLTKLTAQLMAQIDYNAETFDVDYTLFYPLNDGYEEKYESSSYIHRINQEKDYKYAQRIKHKELNDANEVFCNP